MSENFFKTKIAYNNWKGKYQYKNETPLGTFQRIACELASNEKNPEKWYDIFLNTLIKFNSSGISTGIKCSPGGRITTNIGTDYNNATLMNCFINGPVQNATISYVRKNEHFKNKIKITSPDNPDDLTNIFLTILEQAKTLAAEGGYGLNFDFIRPRGSIIKGTGIRHPGVLSYMEVWDRVAECIVKGSDDGYLDTLKDYTTKEERDAFFGTIEKETRKGAMMGSLSIWHPDIEEFVKAKQMSGKLTKFNMSVAVTDDFMLCVEKDTMWDLTWEGQVVKRVKARHLYDLIMKSTYNRAEPGILFIDNMDKNNPINYLGKTNCTNPCVVKGTLIATKDGLKKVEDVTVDENIQTTLGYGKVKNIEVHKNHPVYRVNFTDGFHQDVTEGHIFHTQNKTLDNRKRWDNNTRLKDLNIGDIVRKQQYLNMDSDDTCNTVSPVSSIMYINDIRFESRDIGLLIGLYFGDGCFSNYENFNIATNLNDDNKFIIDLYKRLGFKYRIDKCEGDCVRYYATHTDKKIKNIFNFLCLNPNDKFNFDAVTLLNLNAYFLSGLLDGLISSDGNVNLTSRYPQVRFKNVSENLHFLMKHIMLKAGCDYKKYLAGKEGDKSIIYGRDVVRQNDIYDGVIDNDSIINFYSYVKYLSHTNKNEKLKTIIKTTSLNGNKWKTTIKNIEFLGYDDVYDLYEPNADDWNAEGYVSRGCGEIPGNPIMSTVCLLGSINLTQYVEISDGVSYFNWELYKKDIVIYSRMLDNVCDLTELPLPSYAWAVKNLRQFGMGLNGLGSMFIMLGIKYNSKEAVDMTAKLKKLKENLTMQSSSLLAKEKGSFPLYNYDELIKTDYFKSDRLTEETKKMIKENGLRNAKTTTNPPLGNCLSKDTIIHTDTGKKVLKDLFIDNGIEYKEYENQWFVPISNTCVFTHSNKLKRITGLFVKGVADGIEIKTTDDNIIGKAEHKVLVKVDDEHIKWTMLSNLKIGDILLSKKNKLSEIESIKNIKDFMLDIEVEDDHSYVVNNGLISHNSSVICDNVSNGIEPVFDLESERKVMCGFPEGLTSENLKTIFIKRKRKDFIYWEGEYEGKKYYYEPHNRGLCEVYRLRDYGYQWILDNYPENKKADFLVTTSNLDIQDHLNIQEKAQYYCNQSVSKCLVEGQEVNTNFGYLPIEDLCDDELKGEGFYKIKPNTKVYDEYGKLINVKEFYYGGLKPSYKITFSNGSEILVSENHKIKCVDGLKNAKELLLNDTVYIQNYNNKNNIGNIKININKNIFYNSIKRQFPTHMNTELSKLLGMLISDGYIGKYTFSLTEKNKYVGDLYDKLCKNVFDIIPTQVKDGRNDVISHNISSKPLCRNFKKHDW